MQKKKKAGTLQSTRTQVRFNLIKIQNKIKYKYTQLLQMLATELLKGQRSAS